MAGPALFEIEHVSRYIYASPVRHCVMALCMKPRDDNGQRLLHFEASTVPHAPLNDEVDGFGNTKQVLTLHTAHEVLEVTARSTVETNRGASSSRIPRRLGMGRRPRIGGVFCPLGLHSRQLGGPLDARAC